MQGDTESCQSWQVNMDLFGIDSGCLLKWEVKYDD